LSFGSERCEPRSKQRFGLRRFRRFALRRRLVFHARLRLSAAPSDQLRMFT